MINEDSQFYLNSPQQNPDKQLIMNEQDQIDQSIQPQVQSLHRQSKLQQRTIELLQRSVLKDDGSLIMFDEDFLDDNSISNSLNNSQRLKSTFRKQVISYKSNNFNFNNVEESSNKNLPENQDKENQSQPQVSINSKEDKQKNFLQIDQQNQNNLYNDQNCPYNGAPKTPVSKFLQNQNIQSNRTSSLKDSSQQSVYLKSDKLTSLQENFNEKLVREQIRLDQKNQDIRLGIHKSINFILQITQLLRYCKKIREYSITYSERIFQQKPNIAKIIGDQSYIQKNNSRFSQLLKYEPKVFHPHQRFYIFWSLCKLFFISQGIYLAALEATFDFDTDMSNFDWYIYCFLISLIDIIITFNVGVYIEGNIIIDHKQIANHYVKNSLWIDFVGSLSFLLQNLTKENYFLLLFLVRIFQIQGILNHIDNVYQLQQRFVSAYELIKLLLINCYVAHFMGCVFYYVAIKETDVDPNAQTWVVSRGIQNSHWLEQYTESLYFSFITMSTVGYGDISPTTTVEKIVTIILTLVSCGIFAYSVSTIGDIFRQISIRSATLKMKKFYVSQYMVKRHINKANQLQVLKSLEYMDQQVEKGNIKGLEILQQMQKNIQDEIFLDYFSSVLLQSQLIKHGKYSLQFVKALAIKMNEITTAPDQIIYQQNQFNENFYFLMEGSLVVYYQQDLSTDNSKQKEISNIRHFQDGFGYQLLYTQQKSQYSVKSQQVSRLAYFKHQDFFETLQQFPEDYERFILIQTQMLHYLKPILLKCFYCQSKVHSTNNCLQVHFNKRKNQLIGRYNQPSQQYRHRYYRCITKNQSLKSLSDLQYIREQLMKTRTNIVSQYIDQQLYYDVNVRDIDFYNDFPKINFENGQVAGIGKTDTDEEDLEMYYFIENGLHDKQDSDYSETFSENDLESDKENVKNDSQALKSMVYQNQNNKNRQKNNFNKSTLLVSQDNINLNFQNSKIAASNIQNSMQQQQYGSKEDLFNGKYNNKIKDLNQYTESSSLQELEEEQDKMYFNIQTMGANSNKPSSQKFLASARPKSYTNYNNNLDFQKQNNISSIKQEIENIQNSQYMANNGIGKRNNIRQNSNIKKSSRMNFSKKPTKNFYKEKDNFIEKSQLQPMLYLQTKDYNSIKQTSYHTSTHDKDSQDCNSFIIQSRRMQSQKSNLFKNLNKNLLELGSVIKTKEQFITIELDRLKNFNIYLPNENVNFILKNIKKKQMLQKEIDQALLKASKMVQQNKYSKLLNSSYRESKRLNKKDSSLYN